MKIVDIQAVVWNVVAVIDNTQLAKYKDLEIRDGGLPKSSSTNKTRADT